MEYNLGLVILTILSIFICAIFSYGTYKLSKLSIKDNENNNPSETDILIQINKRLERIEKKL